MPLTAMSRGQGHILHQKAGVKSNMPESTKIEFRYRKIREIADFTELVEMLLPGNRNQQHAAARILFELKWANSMVPNMAYMEARYNISRRILQRTRAKLARLGLIEHISYLNSRYGGQAGWKLSGRFGSALRLLAEKLDSWRSDKQKARKGKEKALIDIF